MIGLTWHDTSVYRYDEAPMTYFVEYWQV